MSRQTASDISPVMRELSAYIAAASPALLPRSSKDQTHILDTLAAMISGSRLAPGTKAIGYVKTLGGVKEAMVIGSKILTSAVNAALVNGMLAHADETDDSHAPSQTHPGCGIVPAALAMAEREGRGGYRADPRRGARLRCRLPVDASSRRVSVSRGWPFDP
jgi:2-methylcitrate dehydratase PrpD